MKKIPQEPRLTQGPAFMERLIGWMRDAANAFNPMADAVGEPRAGATPISQALDGPTFSAYRSTAQSFAHAAVTIMLPNIEEWDTAGCYDPVTGRFTPNLPGYYHFTGQTLMLPTAGNISTVSAYLYKNGSPVRRGDYQNFAASILSACVDGTIFCNGTTDYVQLGIYTQTSGGAASTPYISEPPLDNRFSGFLARRA